jgi:hypothetical protein
MNKIHILIMCASLFSFAVNAGTLDCRLTYDIKGWSILYKEYKGTGFVSCNNGQRASVSIVSRGAGLTIGKSQINKGRGSFSSLLHINEIYGTYIALDVHAGASVSVEAQIMTKGEISLALSGNGRGVNLGVALSGFSIKPR